MKTSLLSIGILTLFLMIGGNSVFADCTQQQIDTLIEKLRTEKDPNIKQRLQLEYANCNEDTKSTSIESTGFQNKSKDCDNTKKLIETAKTEELKKIYTDDYNSKCITNDGFCQTQNNDKIRNSQTKSCEFKYYGGNPSRGGVKSNPQDVLQMVAGKANEDRIFDNELNKVNRLQGGYSQTFKISNTLDSIRQNIAPYMQWAVFLGLSIAVLLIIYNGFLLVTNNVSDMKLEKAKSNIINILTGVAVLTGFYLIIRLVVSLLANFS